ncbi:divergent PAP2 family protein [Salirhabdus salicampi]|uniref:divergent PAP2 family protein n=1 Tax=Salirhabdus salicampi TaxID=476102 RepID=UPI0020C1BEAA|nr:divergent PAP2 family protein [Salirhabdus salicampi]MCP8616053.1 divergent PAP2 family protein [Salirhabdus salicampi]
MFISFPLLAALLAMVIAQFIKIPLHFMATREWKPGLMFSTGGMPSSHTATVMALTTSIGLLEGFHSNQFAISLVLAVIVMHDATGVRRHAGHHAQILNQMVNDFNIIVDVIKHPNFKKYETREKLKELLGHQPAEVFFGALLGIVVGLLMYGFYPHI